MKRREILRIGVAIAALWMLGGCASQPAPQPGGKAPYHVYLTTDDGPMRCSGALNQVILKEKVPLEAFVVGKHARSPLYRSYVEAYPANPYVTLANHSYSHANGHYLGYYRHPEKILEEFERTKRELNLPGKVGRLPGWDSWRIGGRAYDADKSATAAADLLAANGWKLYGWDLEWTHTRSGKPIGTAETLYRKIRAQLEGGHTFTRGHLVLLLHDQMFGTPQAQAELARLIERLKKDPQIRLEALSDYPSSGVQVPAKRKARLVPAPATGVGESTPVDPLKFAH